MTLPAIASSDLPFAPGDLLAIHATKRPHLAVVVARFPQRCGGLGETVVWTLNLQDFERCKGGFSNGSYICHGEDYDARVSTEVQRRLALYA